MEQLRQQIIKLVNESQLPLEAIVFVVRDVLRDAQESLRTFEEQQKLQEAQQSQEEIAEEVKED